MTVYKAVANEAVVTLDLAKAMLAGDQNCVITDVYKRQCRKVAAFTISMKYLHILRLFCK